MKDEVYSFQTVLVKVDGGDYLSPEVDLDTYIGSNLQLVKVYVFVQDVDGDIVIEVLDQGTPFSTYIP
jgi:hypothetical protein